MIIESMPLLTIPTDPIKLADLLDRYSSDWKADLAFLFAISHAKGIEIDYTKVTEIMNERYSE